jgi:hypothetical protein
MRRARPLAALGVALTVLTVASLVSGSSPRASVARSGSAFAGLPSLAGGAEEEGESLEGPPDEWMLTQRLTGSAITPAAVAEASAQAALIRRQTATAAPDLAQAAWTLAGPTNIGGRIVDVAVDPTLTDTIYVAAATGGIWKSTDAGNTFSPIWPASSPQAMGALAMGSDATLYAGAGEANPGGGSISFGGKGLYRSTDRGATWKLVGLKGVDRIGRIAVDPSDPKRVFAAAAGSLFSPGGPRGLYRSIDRGRSWSLVLPGDNATTGAIDVAIDPNDPLVVYAAMWDHLREPDLRTYGGVGSGVFRSADGGTTWSRLAGGLPAPSPNVGRIGVAVAPSDSNRVYAIVIKTDGTFRGFFVSDDAGDSWTEAPTSGLLSSSQSTYGWWFGRVWVDPANEDQAFVGGVPLIVSSNGGATWTDAGGGVHADQHAMAWDPKDPGRVYLGNDGGVYRSEVNGEPPWTKGTYEPFTQFYSVDVSQQDTTRLVGGAQDNGALRSYPTNWNAYGGGDGEEALINPTDQLNVFACSQYGFCTRSTNGGNSSSQIGATTSDRRNWFTPLQFDPTNPQVMYYGGNRLNRSVNNGVSWTVISPDLTGGPGRDPAYPFGTMTTVAAAKTDGNVILLGTDDGRVWRTANLGGQWTQQVDADLPAIWVSRVAIDPANASVEYATFSGFRADDPAPYVARTTDGGATWTDISGNLPKAPVNDLIVNGSALFVGTDVGVYRSTNGGVTWQAVGSDLPNVPVTDLEIGTATNVLVAATFGRGIWTVPLR